MNRIILTALALGLAPAALAVVPGQLNYQGLLLDDQGVAVTASVAMNFELFDADSGGTSLWSENHASVQVVGGVYDVTLGETTPLTAALVSGGSLHLEVTVDGEILSPRQPLLVVPYALRSAVSENTEQVNGFSGDYLMEMLEHFSFDGEAPDNLDPQEQLGDPDGDGIANFLDADNDDDGLADGFEIAQGSDINLVTPTVTGFDPSSADGFETTTVEVGGTNFEPGLTVVFGSQAPTPMNVTPTPFDVDVGPQPEGSVAVSVMLPNAESVASTYDFFFLVPSIDLFVPDQLDEGESGTVTVTGQNFIAGMTVQFGAQTPTPTSKTATSFDVAVAGTEPTGQVSVTVTLPNGKQATNDTGFRVGNPRIIFTTSAVYNGNLGGLPGADAICNSLATAAGLVGTFQAWLADGVDSPNTRESRLGSPYVRTTGAIVAGDWADLTDGTLDLAVLLDENGGTPCCGVNFVWTNVAAVGAGAETSTHCSGWT